jgi:hypothetical protein
MAIGTGRDKHVFVSPTQRPSPPIHQQTHIGVFVTFANTLEHLLLGVDHRDVDDIALHKGELVEDAYRAMEESTSGGQGLSPSRYT